MPDTIVRPAVATDVPAVLALISELAEYERAAGSAVATEADLTAALFGAAPTVFALVADDCGTVVGAAIWYVTFSTWVGRHGIHLEDLVVSDAARGRGVGRALLGELRRIAGERGYRRVDWRVLDWNVDAQAFYRASGAAPMPEWVSWRLTLPNRDG